MKKYTNITDKDKPENKDKIVLSNEAYALAEWLENLTNKIENVSQRLNNG